MKIPENKYLSYSDLVKQKHCPKALWFRHFRPDLRQKKDETRRFIIEEERYVKTLVASRFPKATVLGTQTNSLSEHLQETQKAIEAPIFFVFNAVFKVENRLIRCDGLQRTEEGYVLYGIKSSNRVKHGQIEELAYTVEGLGHLEIVPKAIFLYTLNPEYVFKNKLSPKKAVKRHRLTRRIKSRVKHIVTRLDEMSATLSQESAPIVEISPHCLSPHPCPFQSQCWDHIPSPSIFEISGMAKANKFLLYEKGYTSLASLPTSTRLSNTQKLQIQSLLDEFTHVNQDKIKDFLTPITYPIYHLDFEAVQHNVPRFEGTTSYQAVPFQFSLHIQEAPQQEPTHIEFIAPPNADPRKPLTQALIEHIPPNSTIVVFNAHFEKSVLQQLGEFSPHAKKHLLSLTHQIVDLMIPFQNFHYYAPIMKGSHSIKSVLPALIPEFSYDHLAISNGELAAKRYAHLFHEEDLSEFETLKPDFLAYCELDTLAMVKLLDKLWQVI